MEKIISVIICFLSFPIMLLYGQDANNKVKLSGTMFGDYFYNIENVDGNQKDLNGFQFRRIFLTTDFYVADNFDARFRLDADQSSNSLTSGGKVGVLVRDAYLKWKNVFNGSDLVFGIAPTPTTEVYDAVWNYRSLEKSMLDLMGVISSRDIGIDLKGKIIDDGTVNYWIKIGNNSNNAPENNKYKRYYGLLQFKPIEGAQIVLYGDYAVAAKKQDPYDKSSKSNNAIAGEVFLNYQIKNDYGFGVETLLRVIQNNYSKNQNTTLQNQNNFGISLWTWGTIIENLKYVLRFDNFDANNKVDNDATRFFLVGLDYKAAKNISIIPNVEIFSFQGKDDKNITGRLTLSLTY